MRYSVRQAAELAGISRKTLYAHIKQGKVSAHKDDQGDKVIDHSELLRVYGKQLKTPEDKGNSSQSNPVEVGESVLQAELDKAKRNATIMMTNLQSLRKENELLKTMLSDAREREREMAKKHEMTLSIFERMLPGIKDR